MSAKRDKQIFVRVDQDTYDYVATQSEETGMSIGRVAALLLEEAKDRGWAVVPGRVVEGEN